VRIHIRPGPGGHTIAVSDDGPGIPPERLEKLFAPFVRGDTGGKSGVGLGLYIARQAAEILGASLTAESKLGEGTTFSLTLRE
jgi:signal transduction histidine kinase